MYCVCLHVLCLLYCCSYGPFGAPELKCAYLFTLLHMKMSYTLIEMYDKNCPIKRSCIKENSNSGKIKSWFPNGLRNVCIKNNSKFLSVKHKLQKLNIKRTKMNLENTKFHYHTKIRNVLLTQISFNETEEQSPTKK